MSLWTPPTISEILSSPQEYSFNSSLKKVSQTLTESAKNVSAWGGILLLPLASPSLSCNSVSHDTQSDLHASPNSASSRRTKFILFFFFRVWKSVILSLSLASSESKSFLNEHFLCVSIKCFMSSLIGSNSLFWTTSDLTPQTLSKQTGSSSVSIAPFSSSDFVLSRNFATFAMSPLSSSLPSTSSTLTILSSLPRFRKRSIVPRVSYMCVFFR
mmetsp:Transcript_15179/g.38083  ORF Transcript_15179/g.38083 Transcript_15179/m.38083 type:complete len:214 (-) Transcript_15179:1367-2008(-)